jgi:hypothetical protein
MKRLATEVFCFVLLSVGITILVSRSSTPAHAQGTCAVPKAFGTLRGAGAGGSAGLVFEASNGTIRIFAPGACQLVDTIERQ